MKGAFGGGRGWWGVAGGDDGLSVATACMHACRHCPVPTQPNPGTPMPGAHGVMAVIMGYGVDARGAGTKSHCGRRACSSLGGPYRTASSRGRRVLATAPVRASYAAPCPPGPHARHLFRAAGHLLYAAGHLLYAAGHLLHAVGHLRHGTPFHRCYPARSAVRLRALIV